MDETETTLVWLENVLPGIMRRLMDSDNLDMPLLQLPLAQMRLAQALYIESETESLATGGETMGRLSERLAVRQNALTQAADRLFNHGLAERLNDPHDRRVVRLRLTTKGREWVSARRERRRARLNLLWDTLSPTERTEFLQAVRTLETAAGRLPNHTTPEARPEETALSTIEETLSRFTVGAARAS